MTNKLKSDYNRVNNILMFKFFSFLFGKKSKATKVGKTGGKNGGKM